MHIKKLGYSDLNITNVGLGTWAIGGGGWKFAWGPQDDKESIAAIRKAIDIGINWIDTAALYGLGHSEEIVGTAIKEMKETWKEGKFEVIWWVQYESLKSWQR